MHTTVKLGRFWHLSCGRARRRIGYKKEESGSMLEDVKLELCFDWEVIFRLFMGCFN
jgi:hypothetical protein